MKKPMPLPITAARAMQLAPASTPVNSLSQLLLSLCINACVKPSISAGIIRRMIQSQPGFQIEKVNIGSAKYPA